MKAFTFRLVCMLVFVSFLFLPLPVRGSEGGIQLQNLESVDAVLESATSVSTGGYHSCALTSSGEVKCWGLNYYGQLGDGTTIDSLVSVKVVGLSSGVMTVTAGGEHNCALTSSGGVKCWGENGTGQLGDGTYTHRTTPVDAVGLASGINAVSTGWKHTCALTSSGGVKCWGANESGQLGDGTTNDISTPLDVVGLSSGVTAVSAGKAHTCALTNSGGVKCWGANDSGQLGNGTITNHMTPEDVIGLANSVTAISAGSHHTCALIINGGIKCWGANWYGQLGDDTTTQHNFPVEVVGMTSGVTTISSGEYHTCALSSSGGVKCWGANWYGQLGDGTNINRWTPVDVVGMINSMAAVSAGGYHTCGLISSGGVKCWGANWYGQLGDGTNIDRWTPVEMIGLMSKAIGISAGGAHTCALTDSGGVKCWGRNDYGQLGDGTEIDRNRAVSVNGLSESVTAISAGDDHTCALTANGGVKCWGDNQYYQLGDGTSIQRLTPVDVKALTGGVVAISAGGSHTCALTDSGGVKCWGYNYFGQLGNGTFGVRAMPWDVIGLSSGITAISAGGVHTCALTSSGGVKCWGANSGGQLGEGTTTQSNTPKDVSGLASGIIALSAGGNHTCTLGSSGGAKCWGSNGYGQLGDGTNMDHTTPVDVVGLIGGVDQISAGGGHTCALADSGGVRCWGENHLGELGDGTFTHRNTPGDVVGLKSGLIEISAWWVHTCTLTISGGVKCWGANESGQLGDGTYTYRNIPVDVIGFGVEMGNPIYLPSVRKH